MAIIKTLETAKVNCQVSYECNNEKILKKIIDIKEKLIIETSEEERKILLENLKSLLDKCEVIDVDSSEQKYDFKLFCIDHIDL